MHTKRIIPCLDVRDGKVVKGINFVGIKEIGDPVLLGEYYYNQGADELVFLDITASHENRGIMEKVVERVAEKIFIPFTVGGGLRNIEDIKRILRAGADKVSLNSAAVRNKGLIKEGAYYFGNQCIVLAVDAKRRQDNKGWNVFVNGGRIDTGINVLKWIEEATKLGAGEILLTSMEADGTKNGFDIELIKRANEVTNVPIIASGGCGKIEDFLEVFKDGMADAALAASLFHYGEISIQEVKKYLKENGINVRSFNN
ncbi:imidazole glycerol phosphate synthase subunit HisF [Clostridium celatum]|uniref:Imidazole glycerol phosphate synthase subunit HisF n=1 Tax=Clostridium celatum DSM 1785 TaxID=545697 RepID=L1QBW3_9CLOT|nr:imidazole glycerol phosphate synthase subunit HisF [Clostridium celatum]EKY25102.1 imidazoleglycerol phosphate synthase, cyclase subunit [Clostridium celatum DSM 1785]MCE9655938.1 imidazole glycerol phosphate synthase subunit HisF [Clostridium celatum]MDU3722625.1 imidazole glycerol phosphate synthase subunit HisF [Clostridium celatum]MDU6294867.1 imidazole glycerol phosphate synthase subunit HisF [Clostridium celatum]MDY3361067.1 imidazole glycerol phosphate synthase subunit HisF [Clostrid